MNDEVFYLRSIHRQLRELRGMLSKRLAKEGASLGREVLADNIDWLDCYIDELERRAKRAGKAKGKVSTGRGYPTTPQVR